MATPHNTAEKGQIAKTVLMPGDPLRAKFIAENFLDEPVLVNNVRGIQGYTGKKSGIDVTVMGSGMGIPSIGIYSYELYNFYGVEDIIRVGSAGALADELKLRDIVAGMSAGTDSAFAQKFGVPGTLAPTASFALLRTAVECAEARTLSIRVGSLLSSDSFYGDENSDLGKWKRMGVLAVEMEAAGLYLTAARAGKRALCLCTVSDHIYRPDELMSAEERQLGFAEMIGLALDVAVKMG
ncbi:MAG: purine-nucleoside phosphorylase [Oscillospiraceae bacterium]|jgi:purine-nucleoside phosphorylase|nr:purine-nucleoside phosphorylase [Oscillospiraceae bacterium]